MHRTLLDEHFRIKSREKRYESVDEMQTYLDDYLVPYNTKRPIRGRHERQNALCRVRERPAKGEESRCKSHRTNGITETARQEWTDK